MADAASSDREVLLAHLFRHQAGAMVSVLVRLFGSAHLDLVEDVVQDALVRALEVWPLKGVPDNPRAWLIEVAKHRALDVVRREAHFSRSIEQALTALQASQFEEPDGGFMPLACADDTLAMLFMCCHPDIARESQVALALKVVAGLGTGEIARGLMTAEATVLQRIVRAKRLIRERNISVDMPLAAELPRRREAVLATLYLWFNEGYLAFEGELLVRADLCNEALRLAWLVAEHPKSTAPEAHALVALMAFNASRLDARTDDDGELLLLREQDRSTWDRALIQLGFQHLELCASGEELGSYQIEAGIAACHAGAQRFEDTDWQTIAGLYRLLIQVNPSPIVRLNAALAQSRTSGPQAGINEILGLAAEAPLRDHARTWAVLGELALESGRRADARAWFSRALELPCSVPEQRHLRVRLAGIV